MDDNNKSLHIHTGGLILFIIIVLLLFKVNLKSAIDSPQFQSNVNYIEQKGKDAWNQYLSKPIFYIWNNLLSDLLKQSFNTVVKPNLNVDNILKASKIQNKLGNFNNEDFSLSNPAKN